MLDSAANLTALSVTANFSTATRILSFARPVALQDSKPCSGVPCFVACSTLAIAFCFRHWAIPQQISRCRGPSFSLSPTTCSLLAFPTQLQAFAPYPQMGLRPLWPIQVPLQPAPQSVVSNLTVPFEAEFAAEASAITKVCSPLSLIGLLATFALPISHSPVFEAWLGAWPARPSLTWSWFCSVAAPKTLGPCLA